MSRLQEAVDKFAADWAKRGEGNPGQDLLFDGTFSRSTGQPFCLCFKLFTGLGAMISMKDLSCTDCLKPVTAESYAWAKEARAERAVGEHEQ